MDANLKTEDCLLHIRNHPHIIFQSALLDNDVPKCTQCPRISLFIVLPTIHSNLTFGSREPIIIVCPAMGSQNTLIPFYTQMQYEYYRHTLQFADTTLILVCTLNEFILWHIQHPLEYTCIYNRLSDSSICSGDPIFHTLITQPLFRSQFHTQVFLFTY